jgi:hypothetical protein
VIETLTTNASKVALARCIHKRGPHCRSHDFHSGTVCHPVEFSTELVVVIANDSPTTAGKGRVDSCSKRFVLATKRVNPVRMRRPSGDDTARWFCSKSGNRSSLAEIGKFNDHAAEESNSQHSLRSQLEYLRLSL